MSFETKQRTVARAVVYRLVAFAITVLLTYLNTGELGKSTAFSVVLHALLSIAYYFHERAWLHVRWGLADRPPRPVEPICVEVPASR